MEAVKAMCFDVVPQTALNINDKKDLKRQGKTPDDVRSSNVISVMCTLLFVVCNVMVNVFTSWYVRKTQLRLFFAWSQSCFAIALLWRNDRRSLSDLIQSIKLYPGVFFYIVFVVITETCSNKLNSNCTGPEAIQLGLVTSPLFVVLGTLWFDRKIQPSVVMAFVTVISLIMTIIVCSTEELFFPFKVTLFNGLLGLCCGMATAFMALSFRNEFISGQLSIVQQLFSLNLGCVICFPFVMVATGEVSHILTKGLPTSWFYVLITAFTLGIVRLLDQASCLYQIKYTSSLHHIATRGLAWIPISLILVFTLKLELMIASLVCFWLVLAIFLAVFVDHLTDINT